MARTLTRPITVVLLIAAVTGLVTASVHYRHDIQQARYRVLHNSQIAQTPCGAIEYAAAGQGPPIMMVHGAGGGFDQALDFSVRLVNQGFQVIAMSRFGYLRTPLPEDASPSTQADAHACLLDALHIDNVAVIGGSAGAPSSLQFALRHPTRITALVLLVPATYVPRAANAPAVSTPPGTQFLFNTALQSDILFWLMSRLARDTMLRAVLATPPEVVNAAPFEEQARVERVLAHLLPISERRLGLLNEAAILPFLGRYELERIKVHTLTISCADDLFGTYEGAQYTATHIPGGRFLGYPTGGHLWVGHDEEIMREIAEFLKDSIRR